MNWIARLWHSRPRAALCPALTACLLALAACDPPPINGGATIPVTAQGSAPVSVQAPEESAAVTTEDLAEGIYRIEYVVTPLPASGEIQVTMHLRQDEFLLREIDMRAPGTQFHTVSGDGSVSHDGVRVKWQPPEGGGSLNWIAIIDHKRNEQSYDAYMAADWSIFRAEDIIPQLRSRARSNAISQTVLTFRLPPGWSSVTEYFGRNHRYVIDNPERRFDRPAGWILLGNIGVRRDRIGDVRVSVAAPVGQQMRRLDTLALLRWSIPELVRILPDFPTRLTIIGAGDPMWRGGLSGPRSLFMHSDRPLLSENGTSTLVHEIVHVGMGGGAGPGADWIVEGLAEFYSLEVLRRSGTISDDRFNSSLRRLAEWGNEADVLCLDRSSGAATALAVTLFAALDVEIRSRTDGDSSLDDVTRALAANEEDITIELLLNNVAELIGASSNILTASAMKGCNI